MPATRPLKVYNLTLHCSPADRKRFGSRMQSHHAQVSAVVATTSQRAAAEAFGVPVSNLRNYGGETWNDLDHAAAMTEPGTVFIRPLDDWNGEYVKRDQ